MLSTRVVILVALLPSVLFGQNILTNPGFDANVSGWNNQGGVWSTLDAANTTTSGSVQLSHPSTGTPQQIIQCRAAVAPGVYSAGVKYRIPAGQATTGIAVLRVWTFTTNDCTGSFQEVRGQEFAPPLFDTWLTAQQITRVPDGAGSALFQVFFQRNETTGSFTGFFDDAFLVASDAGLPLGSFGRFLVETTYETSDQSGAGHSRLLTNDTGYFWFFNSANVEVVVKVLDGCGVNNRFWVFAAGLTNVHTVVKVTDRQRGTVKTYNNPQGTAFAPIQDTGAFICP